MLDRFTASVTARVTLITDVVRDNTDFCLRVVLPASVYQSPTGEEIDIPELKATVYGDTCSITVEMVTLYVDILERLELDVLHCQSVMLSFAVGELQYVRTYTNDLSEIDNEIDDDVTLLHRHKQIDADLIIR